MQQINLTKTINFEGDIKDLLLISIDDQIDKICDKEGVKVIGKILVGGKVMLEEEQEFEDTVNIDMFLVNEEILDMGCLNVTVSDFNYKIEQNKLILDISLKLEGLKEIETSFLSLEDTEDVQEKIEEDRTYVDLNEEIIAEETTDEETIDEETTDEEIQDDEPKKSLLKSVFSSKKIKEEVSWVLHCVKSDDTYEKISEKYKVNLNKLKSINNNEVLNEGKLIFLPLE